MNERDSEAVAAQLVAKGYALAPSEHVADVVLLNTCSVRDFAEQKAIGKMQNLADDDLAVGTQKFHRTADYLDDILPGRRDKIVDIAEEQGSEATIREHVLN